MAVYGRARLALHRHVRLRGLTDGGELVWFDAPTWVHSRLTEAFPDWLVTPERDAKVNRYPALVWALSVSNPEHRGIWTGNLTLNLLCAAGDAPAGTEAVHEAVMAWQTPGPAHSVTLNMFTQNPSDVSETIKQYVFIYSLTWDN